MSKQRFAHATAYALANEIATTVERGGHQIAIAGSLRRECATVGDIDLVVLTANLDGVTLPDWLVLERGGAAYRRFTAPGDGGIGVDIWRCPDVDSWGGFMLFATGSATYNIHTRRRAKARGFVLNQSGLSRDGVRLALSERAIPETLGLPYLTPREREAWGNRNTTTNQQEEMK